jgi:transcriptional regulator with XRE-family HTH domain
MSALTLLLRPARIEKGWSQIELARRAGVASETISRIESGNVRGVGLGTLVRLADALQVSPKSLLAEPSPPFVGL